MQKNTTNSGALKVMLPTGLLAGTLDAAAACILSIPASPADVFRYIASGAYGKPAFTGGGEMVFWGILFHYLIAIGCSIVLFLMFPAFKKAFKNKYLIAVVFAALTWLVTNLVIVPLSRLGFHPMHLKGISITFGILIITIGLPVALVADWYYRRRNA